jgi:hypothetical protein
VRGFCRTKSQYTGKEHKAAQNDGKVKRIGVGHFIVLSARSPEGHLKRWRNGGALIFINEKT